MERRNFLNTMGIGGMAIPFLSFVPQNNAPKSQITAPILPKHLSPGDTIGIVSPASAIYESEPYEIATESLQALGLKVKLGKFVKSRHGHLAGTDTERAQELNTMFADPAIDAIICLRGGSGAARLLPLLDYNTIKSNPKIFCGYSDITALHLAIFEKTGLVTYHGPLATSSWVPFTVSHFKNLLFEQNAPLLQNPEGGDKYLTQVQNRIRTINTGKAKGRLLGGNLSVLTGIMGSTYFPDDWEGKILYLEDVGEAIYAVDRMFTQIQLAGVLDKISGFVFGKCTHCEPGGKGYGSLTLEEVIAHYIKPLGIPAFSGSMIGHIDKMFTVPNGVEAEIDAEKGTIQLLDPAVV